METDIIDAAEAILTALEEDTAFPESLSRRLSLDQGYDVQFELLKRRQTRGDVHVGWKVGLTSRAMQLQQGVHEPCLGHLVEAGHVSSPAMFRFDDLMAPGFENELCIRLGAPLDGDTTAQSARSAIDAIAPAIEVVEKRGVFNADLALALAGNAQQRAFVTGEFVPLADDADPAAIEVEVFVNGRSRERALGAEVLGSPINSVVWLARKLATFGHALRPGDLIMSGSFTRQYEIAKRDRVRAVFSGLGAVEIEFG